MLRVFSDILSRFLPKNAEYQEDLMMARELGYEPLNFRENNM
jgi:hypothetical protein